MATHREELREIAGLIFQDPALLSATRPEHILTFTVEVTDTCNLRCVYCHQNTPGFKGGRDLSEDTLNALIAYATKHKVGRVDLTGGGDLLQHTSWREFCQRLVDAGFQVSCTLNLSTALTEEDLAVLCRFATINASIDTMDREVLKRVRKAVDVRQITYNMAAIKAAAVKHRVPGPEWGVSVVSYAESAIGLPDVASFAASFGVKTLRIQDLLEYTSIQDNVTNLWSLRGEQAVATAKAMQAGLKIARNAGMDVYVSTEVEAGLAQMIERGSAGTEAVAARQEHATVGENNSPAAERRTYVSEIPKGMTRSCSDPWSLVFVRANGAVRPCCFAPANYGQLGPDNSLEDIRNGAMAQKLRDDLLSGNLDKYCTSCNMRALIPADRFRHTMSRVMLQQQYPRAARIMVHVDKVRHHCIDVPHLFYLQKLRPIRSQCILFALRLMRKAKHYFIDLPRLVALRGSRKLRHYLIDVPHIIYLRKVRPWI